MYAIAWLTARIPQARGIVSVTAQFGAAGFLVAAISGITWCVVKLREGKRPTANGIKLGALGMIFVMFFPFALVAIVTAGGVIVPHGRSSSWQLGLSNALTTQLCWSILLLIAAWPQLLRTRAPWDMATDQTRRMLSGWAATLAAAATGGVVLLMHLRGAPLASTSAGRVVIAALVTAALLGPLYLMLFKLVWRMGLPEVLSPRRWVRVFRDARADVDLLHAVSHFHERHSKGDPLSACPECLAITAEARRRVRAGVPVCLLCVMESGQFGEDFGEDHKDRDSSGDEVSPAPGHEGAAEPEKQPAESASSGGVNGGEREAPVAHQPSAIERAAAPPISTPSR